MLRIIFHFNQNIKDMSKGITLNQMYSGFTLDIKFLLPCCKNDRGRCDRMVVTLT